MCSTVVWGCQYWNKIRIALIWLLKSEVSIPPVSPRRNSHVQSAPSRRARVHSWGGTRALHPWGHPAPIRCGSACWKECALVWQPRWIHRLRHQYTVPVNKHSSTWHALFLQWQMDFWRSFGGWFRSNRSHNLIASNTGTQVVLERGLPVNVSMQWNPAVYQFMEGISEVGIEYLTIQMR